MSINWDEMPEWADVWIEDLCTPSQSGWHKDSGDRFIDRCRCSYRKSSMDKEQIVHYPPETRSEWNGEGLPPVGTVCEYTKPDGYKGRERVWFKCYVVAHDQGGVVIRTEKSHYHLRKIPEYVFRPLKSDRDRWIENAHILWEEMYPKYADADAAFYFIYNKLAAGELPSPKGSNNESK